MFVEGSCLSLSWIDAQSGCENGNYHQHTGDAGSKRIVLERY